MTAAGAATPQPDLPLGPATATPPARARRATGRRAEIELVGRIRSIVARSSGDLFTGEIETETGERYQLHGTLSDPHVGDTVVATGSYWPGADRTEFRAKSIVRGSGTTLAGIRAYLVSGLFQGVAAAGARKLTDHWGLDTIRQISTDPAGVRVLLKGHAQRFLDSWAENHDRTGATLALFSSGLSLKQIEKVRRHFRTTALSAVVADPYQLSDVKGIGFLTADRIASACGITAADPRRVRAATLYAIDQAIDQYQHTTVPEARLHGFVRKLTGAADSAIASAIQDLIDADRLVPERRDGEAVLTTPHLRRAELEIADAIAKLASSRPYRIDQQRFDRALEAVPRAVREQVAALETLVRSPVAILDGPPGSGKTSVMPALVAYNRSYGIDCIAVGATASAAKRLGNVARVPHYTIQRLLRWSPADRGYQINPSAPLESVTILLEEGTLVDTIVFWHLVRAIGRDVQLLIIGDEAQLPSVGAGQIFKDLIYSGVVPVATLTQNHRSRRNGRPDPIALGARDIRNGRMPALHRITWKPNLRLPDHDDPVMIEADTDHIPSVIEHLLTVEIPRIGARLPDDVQILTPRRETICGINVLNQVAQACLNPNALRRPALLADKPPLPLTGDVVAQTANNYNLHVFNGERGRLKDRRLGGKKRNLPIVEVEFDDAGDLVTYHGDETRELAVAYAISLHRSQGWEYRIVILVMSYAHHIMLTRPLLYTGWSRARDRVYVVGQMQAVHAALRTPGAERITLLRQRLRQRFAELSDDRRP